MSLLNMADRMTGNCFRFNAASAVCISCCTLACGCVCKKLIYFVVNKKSKFKINTANYFSTWILEEYRKNYWTR